MSPFSGATLMITGGTGLFGNTVLKQFLTADIGDIRIFSHNDKKHGDSVTICRCEFLSMRIM